MEQEFNQCKVMVTISAISTDRICVSFHAYSGENILLKLEHIITRLSLHLDKSPHTHSGWIYI